MNTQSLNNVAIVVLNWNGKSDTLECLDSLTKVSFSNLETIVVDNGSTDDSVVTIKTDYPRVTVLETGKNLGFAEGNNVGIRLALERNADYVLLLNNDTVVDSNIIEAFIDAAKKYPNGGVYGAKIYYHAEPKRIWYAGGTWDKNEKCFAQIGDGVDDIGQFNEVVTTEFVVGCAMFIPAQVLKKVGLLESEFFLNYEEIDFCSRIKQAGYENIYVPDAILWHKISVSFGGESSPLKTYFTFRNRLLWAKRNLPFRERFIIHVSVYGGFKKDSLNRCFSLVRKGNHQSKI